MTMSSKNMAEYIKFYNLEKYLFDDVQSKFLADGKLSAFDFFCIVVWKANRAKSKIAQRLLSQDSQNRKDLNVIIEDMTSSLYNAVDDKERMRILIEGWRLRLPMASAILTVLYPDRFTIYDWRVCESLADCHRVQNKTRFDSLWSGYEDFLEKVKHKVPDEQTLRDKDRYLWGQSFETNLVKDIENIFQR